MFWVGTQCSGTNDEQFSGQIVWSFCKYFHVCGFVDVKKFG